jgi:hypothetical protein
VSPAGRRLSRCYFLSPAASAAAAQVTIPRAMSWANSSGEPPSGSNPGAASLPTTSSDLSAALAAAASFSITAGGVPAGATSPNQTVQSKPGSRAYAMVGMLGAMRGRLAAPEASAVRRPASTCGITVEATTSAIDVRPATRSVTCGGLP